MPDCNLDCDRFVKIHNVSWHDLDASMDPQDIIDAANGASDISYGHLNRANYGHKSGGKWVEPTSCSGSDYSNSSLHNKSNYRVLLKACVDALDEADTCQEPWFLQVSGGHGTFAIVLHCERTPDDIVEMIEGLDNYPILDEDDLSELEAEGETEAWTSWLSSDYKRALEKKFPDADFDEVTDEDLYEHLREHMDAENVYWETEGMDRIITSRDLKRVVDAVEELPKGATGSAEPEPGWEMDDDLEGLSRKSSSGKMALPAWARVPSRKRTRR